MKHLTFSRLFLTVFLISLAFFTSCTSGESRRSIIACGGAMNASCPIGHFCKLSEDCGGIDRDGFCALIPQNCSLEESTVCGCDNQEYLNACTANTLSATVKNEGSCILSPKVTTDSE